MWCASSCNQVWAGFWSHDGQPFRNPEGKGCRQLVQNVFSAFHKLFSSPLLPMASDAWLTRLRTHGSDEVPC